MTTAAGGVARAPRPWQMLVFALVALVGAVIIGVAAGAIFAHQAMQPRPRLAAATPGEFAAGPRPIGVPSTAVPIPDRSAPLAIGFLDARSHRAIPRVEVRAKVGDCVVARVQPRGGSAYRRLIGGERWNVAGQPQMQIRPGDAPGYCLVWSKPSGKRGYAVAASAVVANDAGEQALGHGGARVIVQGTPKPSEGSASKIQRSGRVQQRAQASPDDQ